MHPQILLDPQILAQNYAAWRNFAGVPVRPVIKANGYNWGFADLIGALDALCDSYCVGDVEELFAARAYTKHPIVVLNAIPVAQLSDALDAGAIPTVGTLEELSAISRWTENARRKPRIRVGVLPAAGWSGIDLSSIEMLAASLAASQLEIEVWSHVTHAPDTERLRSRVAQAVHSIRSPGGRVAGTDIASTYTLAKSGAIGTTVRVGIGLFGSTGGVAVPGIRCALRVSAPVVRSERLAAGTKVGYGGRKLGEDGDLLTLRCGYGDGLPKGLAASSDILSVGMQYTTMRPPRESFDGDAITLLDAQSDLDAFAAASGLGAHEVVTAFGNAKTSQSVSMRNNAG